MLTSVDVECDIPINLPILGANPRDSLILQSITGLGPPGITLFVGDYARDGGIYSGRRVTTRNPILNIGINPDYSKSEDFDTWRDILYRSFIDPTPGSDSVTLTLHDDIKPNRQLSGYVENFDAETFSSDSVIQVSLLCPNPYIIDSAPTEVTPPAGVPGWQSVPFSYVGTAEVGFEATILIQSDTSTLTLENNGLTMVLSYPFLNGDVVYINTKPGAREITMTRGGSGALEILYTLADDSPWLELHSQANAMQVYGTDATNLVAAVTNLTYTQAYWGV